MKVFLQALLKFRKYKAFNIPFISITLINNNPYGRINQSNTALTGTTLIEYYKVIKNTLEKRNIKI